MVGRVHRLVFTLAAVTGALAVVLGAFGAHGLTKYLARVPDGALRLDWWKTAAQYHLAHALALALSAGLVGDARLGRAASWAFLACIVLFSGSLYTMTLSGLRWLGAITPLGGLCLIGGWVLSAIAGWQRGQ